MGDCLRIAFFDCNFHGSKYLVIVGGKIQYWSFFVLYYIILDDHSAR